MTTDSVTTAPTPQYSISMHGIPFNSKTDNYRIWKLKFIAHISLWKLDNGITEVKADTQSAKTVKALLLMSLDQVVLSMMPNLDKSTPFEILKCLSAIYERTSKQSIYHLKSKLMNEKLKRNDTVNQLIQRINETTEQLRLIQSTPTDDELLITLLNSLISNEQYESIRIALTVNDTITYFKACQCLLDYESTLNKDRPTEYVNHVGKGYTCTHCKKIGHDTEDCDFLLKRCFKCHKTGHRVDDCKQTTNTTDSINKTEFACNLITDDRVRFQC